MTAQFALDPRDQEKYGGPEWVTWDLAVLDDTPFDQIHRWETQLGMGIGALLTREFARGTAMGVKGVIWLARQMSDVPEPSFADFNIRVRRIRSRAPRGDANPPASGSSEPSPETAP